MGKIKFGVMCEYTGNLEENFKKAADLGLDSVMLCATVTDEMKEKMSADIDNIKALSAHYGVEISAFWARWGDPVVWNFFEGQNTLGLIPMEFRDRRMHLILNAAQLASKLGVPDIVTHAGYIPENPYDPVYTSFIDMMRYYCRYSLAPLGVNFNFETGQETPLTLRRALDDIGCDNIGVNLDTANLILYGKGEPCAAMKQLGKYVRCLHLKDGITPETVHEKERHQRPIGEGDVDFPKFFDLLHKYKYKGHFTIEREIEGDQQIADIRAAATYFRGLADKYDWEF